MTQNVVTYATVIDAPNPELKLKPGMTATVTVEVARRANVTRIPNATLRFRPTPAMFAAFGQAALPELSGLAQANGIGVGGSDGFGGTEGRDPERRQRVMERLQQMSPEERQEFLARMREQRGTDGVGGPAGSGRAGQRPAEPRRRANAQDTPNAPAVQRGANTIDALFARSSHPSNWRRPPGASGSWRAGGSPP